MGRSMLRPYKTKGDRLRRRPLQLQAYEAHDWRATAGRVDNRAKLSPLRNRSANKDADDSRRHSLTSKLAQAA
jgi:hypothetical protein